MNKNCTDFTVFSSPLGRMLLAANPHGLCGAWFEGQAHGPAWPDEAVTIAAHGASPLGVPPHPTVLGHTVAWLTRYFQGQPTGDWPALDTAQGTDFQRAVWQQLLTIDPGTTRSYGSIALALGKPQASRAVGAAVGRNPWSVLVPCHRVVGSRGAMTGYAGGLPRKLALLALEGALDPSPVPPKHPSQHRHETPVTQP